MASVVTNSLTLQTHRHNYTGPLTYLQQLFRLCWNFSGNCNTESWTI